MAAASGATATRLSEIGVGSRPQAGGWKRSSARPGKPANDVQSQTQIKNVSFAAERVLLLSRPAQKALLFISKTLNKLNLGYIFE